VVGVSYGGIRGLVVAASMRVSSAITPWVYGGQGEVWHRKTRCGLHIPLPKYAGHSLLRYPKSRSRNLDGGSAVEVVHQLGRWVWLYSATYRCATCMWIGLSKTNNARRRINTSRIKFFPVPLFYQPTQ
jgi:hypothetical protein